MVAVGRERPCYGPAVRFLLALLLALPASAAHADVRARIIATDPPAEATLGRDQAFNVRIQYDADEPTAFWTYAYAGGKRIEKGWKSNASARWSGSGYALGWISFDQPVEVDEIRIVAGGGKPYVQREVARHPVNLRWGDGPAAGATAPWVNELQQATAAAWEAERRTAAANRGAGDALLGLFVMPLFLGLVLACVGAPIWVLWKWRGWWRLAGVAPFAVMAFVIGRIAVDTARDPTSHNLWPFEILYSGAAGLALIAVLAVVRRFTRAGAPAS
jgi:hypothetical protein